uniref:Uncharacterized protein n=1 Tax=Solanum lycopersicum TaxID=4081 RepID=A0A3Q7HH17_SOLLC
MAAVSRFQSLTNKTSLQNIIHRQLLRPGATTAAASVGSSIISPQFQPKSILTGHFSDSKKLSVSNADEFLLNWNFPIGIGSGLPVFDLSLMELRGSRSTILVRTLSNPSGFRAGSSELLQRAWEQAKLAATLDHVGTERCNEAFQKLGKKCNIVVNIQGDEPLIEPEIIDEGDKKLTMRLMVLTPRKM